MPSSRRSQGQLLPRGSDRWLLRVFVGRDGQGKRQYRNERFEGSHRDAKKRLTSLLRMADTKQLAQPTSMTFGQWVDQWKLFKVDISPHTLEDYESKLRAHLLPVFEHERLQALSPERIQEVVSKWIESGMSPRSIEYCLVLLHGILAKAVDLGYIVKNPVDRVSRPKRQARAFTILSPEQMIHLLDVTKDDYLHALWVLLLTTGLRPGEAAGLQWSDLHDGLVTVNRTIRRGKVQETQAKTDGSLRTIVLGSVAEQALAAHRRRQKVLSPYIFRPRTSGRLHYEPTALRRAWKAALKKAGLPDTVRLYDSRHSHATALLNAGVSMKAISDRLGHANMIVTERVYARLLPKAREETAQVFDAILQRGASK